MKSSIILALSASLLTSSSFAKPMAHQHIHKKDLALLRRELVTSTVVEETTTTVDVTVTVYGPAPDTQVNLKAAVNEPAANPDPKPTDGANPPKSDNDHHNEDNTHADAAQQNYSVDTSQNQAQTNQQTPEQIQQQAIDKQNAVNKQQQDINDAQDRKNHGQDQQNQQQPQQNQQQPQQNQQQPQQTQQQPQQPAQASQPPKQGGGGGGGGGGGAPSGGSCGQVGGKCTASDMTIYNDQGIGSCGWTNDTNSEDFFALAAGTFGGYTNDAPGPHKNAFCGRMATISVDGKEFEGMLTDKCPGCTGWSIDLSLSLWNKVTGGKSPDRMHNIDWWFTGPEVFHGAGG